MRVYSCSKFPGDVNPADLRTTLSEKDLGEVLLASNNAAAKLWSPQPKNSLCLVQFA